MLLKEIIMVLSPSVRARVYLQRLLHHEYRPAHVIIMTGGGGPGTKAPPGLVPRKAPDGFCPCLEEELAVTAQRHSLEYTISTACDINSDELIRLLQARPEPYVIYAGAAGVIVCDRVLGLGKKILHVHPGLVPRYRGSTPIYYSLLAEGECGASAFFLSRQIDHGELIASRTFPPPAAGEDIDYIFDPMMRSELLIEVIAGYLGSGHFTAAPQVGIGRTFYIIHPVLKHLSRLRCGI